MYFLLAGYEGHNNAQANTGRGSDGTSSLDCLSLIVESISPVASLQARQPLKFQISPKQEDSDQAL